MAKPRSNPVVSGSYPELAEMVRAITGDVSRQEAADRSGVSHDTIARLWRGAKVNASTLLRFAIGYGVDPNPLLKAAGHPPVEMAGKLPASEVQEAAEVREARNAAPEDALLTPELFSCAEGYRKLREEGRHFVRESFCAAVEYALRKQQHTP